MNKKLMIIALILALAMSMLVLGSCTKDEKNADENTTNAEALTGKVMIAAAASLENTMKDELIPLFNESFSAVEVTATYDSSGKLQEQIEGGLAADIFISAATKQMNALVDAGFIEQDKVLNILENEIVLIKAKGKDSKVDSFANISKADKIAIGDPASVPAGQYAEEVLKNLDLWKSVKSKLSMGTNVTEVLTAVAEGNAQVGIVYKTDAMSIPDKVEVIESAPADSLNSQVIYPIGMLKNVAEDNVEGTKAFFEFLQSDEAKAAFKKAGFTIVEQAN